jgi:hypothetical protein
MMSVWLSFPRRTLLTGGDLEKVRAAVMINLAESRLSGAAAPQETVSLPVKGTTAKGELLASS